ncbi:MAG: ATP-binding protein [Silicimonas sp.]|nr:ATP-binding protein [Silicimonas sp.]
MPDDGVMPNGADIPPGPAFDETFPSDFRWVRRIVQNAVNTLADLGLSTEDLGSFEIVLAEALNNVVEHAYPAASPGKVRLLIKRRPGALMIEIRDRGKPMPQGRAPLGNHPMTEFHQHDAMPEGGYGWYLIREIVRDLVYDRRDDENFLVIRLGIGDPILDAKSSV